MILLYQYIYATHKDTVMPKNPNIKSFNVRMPKETWKFLKRVSLEQERSMMDVINECVEKYRKRLENKLTYDDAQV